MGFISSLGFGRKEVRLYDLQIGDKIEAIRDSPHLAQVKKGDICTVTKVTDTLIKYEDASGYNWCFYLSATNMPPLNESFVRCVPKKLPIQQYEKIRVYDSSLVGGSCKAVNFKVIGNDVVAFLAPHNFVKKNISGMITVNKRQCAKIKGKKNA